MSVTFNSFRNLADGFIDLLFPPSCFYCGTELFGFPEKNICASCLQKIIDDPIRPAEREHGFSGSVSNVFAIGKYDGILREAVHSFKYKHRISLGREIMRVFFSSGKSGISAFSPDAILYVPLHPLREWERGFNQSRIIASELSKALATPSLDILRRRKYTRQQVGLGKVERERNVKGAFAVRRRADKLIAGKKILLVDDVITTGATVSECANVLIREGRASEVAVFAMARR